MESKIKNTILDKWEATGFLIALSAENKIKCSEAFELASTILESDKLENYNDCTAVTIFPIIRRIIDEPEPFSLPESFVFDETNIKHLINLTNEITKIEEILLKHIEPSLVDTVAEIAKFISEIFITEQLNLVQLSKTGKTSVLRKKNNN